MTIFEFRIFHLNEKGCIADHDEKQFRYVAAETEEEAERKLDAYRKDLIKKGFADFMVCGIPNVELEGVIM
jgi:hypothetical protein